MANLVRIAIAVVLALHTFSGIDNYVQAFVSYIYLPPTQLSALQDLYVNWSKNTEDVSSSLPGWTLLDLSISYNKSNYVDPCFRSPWRGVFCYIEFHNYDALENWVYYAAVVSISISDASIVGTLPVTLWNLTGLVSLTLTGNPDLTGSIPPPSQDSANNQDGWRLRSLDLHSNGLSGYLPEELIISNAELEDLNLSNNRLEGPIPATLGQNHRFRTIELSNNTFNGNLPWNLSGNWTNLVILDLSTNEFVGILPNLSNSIFLHTMNLSHNTFSGIIDVSILHPNTTKSLAILDLSNNEFTGPMPNLSGWANIQFLNLSSNSFDDEPLPTWLSSLTGLETLSLRNTSLVGELDLSIIKNLGQLTIVELDDNNITGTLNIDGLLSNISGSVYRISLKNNKIVNVVFSSNDVSSLTIYPELLKGNPYCETKKTDIRRCLCEQICFNSQRSNKGIIIGSAVGGTFGAVMMIIVVFLYRKIRRDKEDHQKDLQLLNEEFAAYKMKPTAIFSLGELQKATDNFGAHNKLGEGGFGEVYKGTLEDGSVVAVKQLGSRADISTKDFFNEVITLTSVIHKNVVKLKGCCLRGDRRLLVYEFVDNYDLAKTLFERRGNQVVTWPARFNICLGVAHGLHYLHAGVEPKIVHRDIKASNVLLDQNLYPKIADFGLAMLFPDVDTHVTVLQGVGTPGYVAPEYATQLRVSDKVDVYSFGVLTLEVVSGRRNLSSDVPAQEVYLRDWAWKLNEEGRLMDLVDPTLSLQNDEEVEEVQRVITTALACIQTAAERRPSMAHVVGMLQGDIQITKSVADSDNEKVNYRALLAGLSGSTTGELEPVDEESQVLYSGESSSSGHWSRGTVELSAIHGKQQANVTAR